MSLPGLPEPKRGKVRDIYDLGETVLFVSTDRISAFDHIMPDLIPDKGIILNKISEWWFRNTDHIIDNHLISTQITSLPEKVQQYSSELTGRSMLAKKAITLPIEFIVRGAITGGGWKEYESTGAIGGNKLPAGLPKDTELEEPVFTPSTKAEVGHDINIDYNQYKEILKVFCNEHDADINADHLKDKAIELFDFGKNTLKKKGILLADTKFEFGLLPDTGKVILIDEALTPDSSRFWDIDSGWKPGQKRINYDKQILRDWLESTGWDKEKAPPRLPNEIVESTSDKYRHVLKLITGHELV
jgi:phosphoribosylaminoimidazole-succinocarboxamide synthase